MGYIYKVTNSVNGKMYVGQTRRTIPERWREHLYYSHKKDPRTKSILYYAIRKYGDNAFSIEEIEQCDNSVLLEREMYWIKKLGTYGNGYNACLGGKGDQKGSDEELLKYWNEGFNIMQIADQVSLHKATVSKKLKAMGVSHEDIIKRSAKTIAKKNSIPIYQYDIDGNFMRSFPSLADAEISIGGGYIRFHKQQNVYAHGFQWTRTKVERLESVRKPPKIIKPKVVRVKKPKPPKKPRVMPTPVYQYTIDGDYVASYRSINEATTKFGLRGSSGVRSTCTGRNRYSHGYRWSYDKVDKLPPLREDKGIRHVAKMDLNGNTIKVYDKIIDAALDNDLVTCSISAACNGRLKTYAGYKWKFYKGELP